MCWQLILTSPQRGRVDSWSCQSRGSYSGLQGSVKVHVSKVVLCVDASKEG